MPRAAVGSSTVLGPAAPPDGPPQQRSEAESGSHSTQQPISTAPIVDLASFVATYTAAQSSARGSAPEHPIPMAGTSTSDHANANSTSAPPETHVLNGRPDLPRNGSTSSTQNSRQKRKEEYDYLQANLDRKDSEIELLQKRCTHLEQYVRKLQSALTDGGLQVPKEPHFGRTTLPAQPMPPAPGPQKLAKQQAAKLVADTVAAASAIPGVRQIRPLASGSSRPAGTAAPSPSARLPASPTHAPARQPLHVYRGEHPASSIADGDAALLRSSERRPPNAADPRLASLNGTGASSSALPEHATGVAERTTPRSAVPPPDVPSLATSKKKTRPNHERDKRPGLSGRMERPGLSGRMEASGSGRGRLDVHEHVQTRHPREAQRPRPTDLEAIVLPTSPPPLPSMLQDAPPSASSHTRSAHSSRTRGVDGGAGPGHGPASTRKLWQTSATQRPPAPNTYAYQQQPESSRSNAGFQSAPPFASPASEARFVPFVFNRTRSQGSEAEQHPMSGDESGYDDYEEYDGYSSNRGYPHAGGSAGPPVGYAPGVPTIAFPPDSLVPAPFAAAAPSSYLPDTLTHLYPGGVFSGGDDLDALSISALFNIEDWGGDDNDDEFVPPSSPPKEDDSDFEEETPGVRHKRRRLHDERADNEDDDDNDDDDDDDMNIAEDEEEDLFQPIEDVPVPMEQLYQDAMDALGVSSRAELATVVAKIVETANKSGGPTTEQVEGLRRLALLAEAQGFYNSASDKNPSRDDRSQS
ncbi:hypothetical protein Q8F55_002038 [Vanrija albida]|uniref:BZIP domain-containing protein n=1 Tax=Vanrija albida TaxID=181172 RepID=A0ABR3Q8T4_9TREE